MTVQRDPPEDGSGDGGGGAAHPPPPAVLGVLQSLRRVTTETDRYVRRAGAEHGTGPSDLAAVSAVLEAEARGEEHGPGTLARHLHLSSPATSAMLDRLEGAGHVRRVRSDGDRRRVVVEPTGSARTLGRSAFAPLAEELAALLAHYDDGELALVQRFLDEAADAVGRSGGRAPR